MRAHITRRFSLPTAIYERLRRWCLRHSNSVLIWDVFHVDGSHARLAGLSDVLVSAALPLLLITIFAGLHSRYRSGPQHFEF